ncbi:MAG: penicillin-binding protein 2 [Anaerolineae bacterium]|nr:penicillin-binding protein 2 [Anaerolineae bacterium]
MIETIDRRLAFVSVIVTLLSVVLVIRLVTLQIQLPEEEIAFLERMRDDSYHDLRYETPARGEIYDRYGYLLATNSLEYQVGISPALIANPEDVLAKLAAAAGRDPVMLWAQWEEQDAAGAYWYPLAGGNVDLATGQTIEDLGLPGVELGPIQRRFYPQSTLAGPVIGFVSLEGQGYYGVEGYYNQQLAGRVEDSASRESNIPFEAAYAPPPQPGANLVLTIDRDVQFLAEGYVRLGMETYEAENAMILVMDPRTGEILAMAASPGYDPNQYGLYPAESYVNPIVGSIYEPGSVFKVLTMACALQVGIVTPDSMYVDEGMIEVGGRKIENWDKRAYGQQDMTQLLVRSLNVGAAKLSTTLGPSRFYPCLEDFNIGAPTGVDLEGEEAGRLKKWGDPVWSESDLGTNAFGQGVSVTPVQMLTAVSAIANQGLLVRPHVIYQQVGVDGVFTAQPQYLGRPISEQVARQVTEMMINVVEYGAPKAKVPGYTVAGKTGTAQIPTPGGYEDGTSIASFIGFLPADAPQVIVLVRLDRPNESIWGTQTAAPLFSEFAQRLVVLLEIPPDATRYNLQVQAAVQE